MLFWTSSTITSPIGSVTANDLLDTGSEIGVSLSLCGYRFTTGCENSLAVNGEIVGLLEALIRVK